MNIKLIILLSSILFFASCSDDEFNTDINSESVESQQLDQNETNFTRDVLNIDDVKKWYIKQSSKIPSSINKSNENIVTSLNVQPMWELAYNWDYADQYPMVIVPFLEEAFLPNSEIQGAKLYIYKNEDSDYSSRILGYIGDSTVYTTSPVSLSVTDFTGHLYQIDEIGRIGMVFKIENGVFDEYGGFPEQYTTSQNLFLKGPECYDWGNNGGFFQTIGSFFKDIWNSVSNFFNGFGDVTDFSGFGFNGYDPVGFGPHGKINDGDPNNWDGFYIENGLDDDIFVYNYFDYEDAVLNLLEILDCLINNGMSENEAINAALSYHMGEDATAFINAFNGSSSPNPQGFDFNDLQKFIYHFHDNHISESTGESVNPELDRALDCDPTYVNDVTEESGTPNLPDDVEVCAHEIKSILANLGIEIPKAQRIELLSSTLPECTDKTAMEEYTLEWLGLTGQDWVYDENYWQDPTLSFPSQDLPSYDDFYNAFPKNSDGSWMYGADAIYNLVGGDVLQARIDEPNQTSNTCALKVSIALNGAGINIPNISGETLEGENGNYYFLNAKALTDWMVLTFGEPDDGITHMKLEGTECELPTNSTAFGNKKGIYSGIRPPGQNVTGHVDIYTGSEGCASWYHCAWGGSVEMHLWILE